MMLRWSCMLAALWMVGLYAQAEASRCPRYRYRNRKSAKDSDGEKCIPCSLCASGWETRRRCSPWKDTVCRKCKSGATFRDGRGKHCRFCKTCASHQAIVKKCTIDSDTECGKCEEGYYWNNIFAKCEPCSWCFPDIMTHIGAFRVTSCAIPKISENFRCLQLSKPPYTQPTWQDHVRLQAEVPKYNSDVNKLSSVRYDDDDKQANAAISDNKLVRFSIFDVTASPSNYESGIATKRNKSIKASLLPTLSTVAIDSHRTINLHKDRTQVAFPLKTDNVFINEIFSSINQSGSNHTPQPRPYRDQSQQSTKQAQLTTNQQPTDVHPVLPGTVACFVVTLSCSAAALTFVACQCFSSKKTPRNSTNFYKIGVVSFIDQV